MNQSGIVWVEEYGNLGRMELSEEMARGFADTLETTKAFTYYDGTATEDIFRGGANAPVEAAQILYFAGFGSEMGPAFGSGRSATAAMMDLGAGSLAYAAFDCCNMLRYAFLERWQEAFEGLHYLLGFGGFVWPDETRGARFAECLRHRGLSIDEAWRHTAMETTPPATSWTVLRAVQRGLQPRDEFWSNDVTIARDPGKPFAFRILQENPERVLTLPPVIIDRLPLFRTLAVVWDPREQLTLAAKFGLDPVDAIAGDGWIELRGATATLELYQGSGAFWFRRTRPAEVALFETTTHFVPSPDAAVARAETYLAERGLKDDRLRLYSVSATDETHRKWDGKNGGGEVSFPAARHISSTLHVSFGALRLPVFGAGAKTQVTLENGDVTEALRFWREPVSDGIVGIMTVDDARELLMESDAFAQVPREAVSLQPEVRLGYYALPPREAQDYLLPVYEFRGTVTGREGLTQEFTRFVQAVPRGERPDGQAFRLRAVLP